MRQDRTAGSGRVPTTDPSKLASSARQDRHRRHAGRIQDAWLRSLTAMHRPAQPTPPRAERFEG
jgi:hypothetical protein